MARAAYARRACEVLTQLMDCERPTDIGLGFRVQWLPDRPPDAPRAGPSAFVGGFIDLGGLGDHLGLRLQARLTGALLEPANPFMTLGLSLTFEFVQHAHFLVGGTYSESPPLQNLGVIVGGDTSIGFGVAFEYHEDFMETRYATLTAGVSFRLPMIFSFLSVMPSSEQGDENEHSLRHCRPSTSR